ncbi:phage tail tape measure protein, partial [Candidatus Uhrbacteria bacterium]|nr:phage tail tape measure protein [Candidatus Uhrbacteria bacterium]
MAATTDTLIFEFKVKDDASNVFSAWSKRLKTLDREARSTFGGFGGIGQIAFGALSNVASRAFDGILQGFGAIKDAATDFAQDSVAAFQKYEAGLAEVSKTTGFTGKQLEELGRSARDLARPIGNLESTDLLRVMEQAGSLGLVAGKSFEEAKQILEDYSVEIGKAAIVMNSFGNDTGKLAQSVATVQNVFGLTADTSKNLLSMWTKLRQETGATELDIANFMTRLSK